MNSQEVLITIIVGAISVAISFYIKDFLMQKSQYRKLRKKLEKVAGKNANVIYGDNEIFKIEEIDEDGITLENDLKTIFIPTAMLLQSETVLPSNNYSKIMKEKKEKEEKEKAKHLLEEFQTVFPGLMSTVNEDSKKSQEEAQELMKHMVNLLEKEVGRDRTQELVSVLMKSGSLQQPDITQLLALKFSEFLSGGQESFQDTDDKINN